MIDHHNEEEYFGPYTVIEGSRGEVLLRRRSQFDVSPEDEQLAREIETLLQGGSA